MAGPVEVDVLPLHRSAGIFDPPVAVAGNIHDGSVGIDGGIGRDGSGTYSGSGRGGSDLFYAEAEGAGFLIGNEQEPPVGAASAAMAIRGGLQLDLYRLLPAGRADPFRETKAPLHQKPDAEYQQREENAEADLSFSASFGHSSAGIELFAQVFQIALGEADLDLGIFQCLDIGIGIDQFLQVGFQFFAPQGLFGNKG